MRRNDFERRRLRDLYDRNVRRVRALAEARDGRRLDKSDDVAAPRRFVVSESRTRLEGFGRGGYQAPRSRRGARGAGARRFSDRSVYRRHAADRFARDDDFERLLRRERLRERRLNDGGLRFGRPRLRLSRNERQELKRLRELRALRDAFGRRRNTDRRRWADDNDAGRQQKKQRGGGRRGGRTAQPATKEQLDAELDRFRGGN